MLELPLRLLYLDSDYLLTLSSPSLTGLRIDVVVEIPPSETTAGDERYLADGVEILSNQALSMGDRLSVYEPTSQLLWEIERLTASGEIDWVVIGNNMGAGLKKAARVSKEMRGRTIIIANSYPVRPEYEKLGFQHFSSRDKFGDLLARLVREQDGWQK